MEGLSWFYAHVGGAPKKKFAAPTVAKLPDVNIPHNWLHYCAFSLFFYAPAYHCGTQCKLNQSP